MPGQYFDAETGYHYNMARYYDPRTGRYLQPDPAGEAGGISAYTYAGGDPVNRVDPTGWIDSAVLGTVKVTADRDFGGGGFADGGFGGSSSFSRGFGRGGSFRGGPKAYGNLGEAVKAQASKPNCPNPPTAPPGINVNENIAIAKDHSWLNPGFSLAFYTLVRNNGLWDYKRQDRQYENFGNFNFGATAAAMGFPYYIAQNGAGIYQQLRGHAIAGRGTPFTKWPYGDAVTDAENIQAGYNYTKQGCTK